MKYKFKLKFKDLYKGFMVNNKIGILYVLFLIK